MYIFLNEKQTSFPKHRNGVENPWNASFPLEGEDPVIKHTES